jgi:hypothetical protein
VGHGASDARHELRGGHTVTPVSATTANVTFAATCAGTIQITGSGPEGQRLGGLDWSAQGAGCGGAELPIQR